MISNIHEKYLTQFLIQQAHNKYKFSVTLFMDLMQVFKFNKQVYLKQKTAAFTEELIHSLGYRAICFSSVSPATQLPPSLYPKAAYLVDARLNSKAFTCYENRDKEL